jgi:hypothetical protein
MADVELGDGANWEMQVAVLYAPPLVLVLLRLSAIEEAFGAGVLRAFCDCEEIATASIPAGDDQMITVISDSSRGFVRGGSEEASCRRTRLRADPEKECDRI